MKRHIVMGAEELAWERLRNGELLDIAERSGFDLLISCDQSLRYQQNFTNRKIAVMILSTNHWPLLRRVAAQLASMADFMQRGQVLRVDVRTLKDDA